MEKFGFNVLGVDDTNLIKEEYQKIIFTLEHGAELLLDTSGFSRSHNDGKGFVQGYNKTLCSDHNIAIYTSEKFFATLSDCKCPVKLRKKRNSSSNEHRHDQSKWISAAADEIRRVLESEIDPEFWNKRRPILLRHSVVSTKNKNV